MIIDSFDTSEAIIGPESFRPSEYYADTAILTFSNEILDAILKRYPYEQVSVINSVNGPKPVMLVNADGISFILAVIGMGSAIAATEVIELNCYAGPDKFILFGSSGSLDEAATKGRFVIPTEAYRDEGLSYHYAPPADYIKIKNAAFMEELFKELGLPYVTGRVWTTDALYRETREQIAKRKADGCIAVDMEIAGVQAVCDFHGFELYDFLQTGDVVDQAEYTPDGLHEANHSTDYIDIALQVVKRIKIGKYK